MDAGVPFIRTPDQRLRVFVSSTLKELAAERSAVRAAIEALRLAPVMFELGARPHPPRDLYRSYLAQSDIFLGLYGDQYGWVAPGEEISGLEDEYRLSGNLPLLVYIREPAPRRDERLAGLLDRIRDDDRTSYRTFASTEELTSLVVSDLATLLADRFDAARAQSAPRTEASEIVSAAALPVPYSRLVGRESERERIKALLEDPAVRLVTIVGPGGIGKSRLAIELATEAAARGTSVAFASLESLTDADQVIPVIARAVGIRDTGDAPVAGKLIAALADRRLLLVVDNMEHLLGAATELVDLLAAAPDLTLLVTSRSPLRVRAERTIPLGPLEVPPAGADRAHAVLTGGVELFVERARAARPDFALTPENSAAVIGVVRALDGIPLAIELAAARLRVLSPRELLLRIDSTLSLLVSGSRDLPARQRALRSTIEWSVRMLDDDNRAALARLAVFRGPFTIAAAEEVLDYDALARMEALLDASLLRHLERPDAELFGMLSPMHAYASEMLEGSPEVRTEVHERWLAHYVSLALDAERGMQGREQFAWLQRAEAESENLIGVMRYLVGERRLDEAAEFAWSLYLLGWIGGLLGVLRSWGVEILDLAQREGHSLSTRAEAIARYYANAIRFWEDADAVVIPGLRRSVAAFAEDGDTGSVALTRISLALALLSGDPSDPIAARAELDTALAEFESVSDRWGTAVTLVALGRVELASGDMEGAREHFAQSLDEATVSDERLGISIAQLHLGWILLLGGDPVGARTLFAAELDAAVLMDHVESVAYGLEGFVGIAAAQGDPTLAGTLAGAAAIQRRRSGFVNSGLLLHEQAIAGLRAEGWGEDVDRGLARGRRMSIEAAVALARDETKAE